MGFTDRGRVYVTKRIADLNSRVYKIALYLASIMLYFFGI